MISKLKSKDVNWPKNLHCLIWVRMVFKLDLTFVCCFVAEYSPSEEPPEGSNIDEDDDEDQILMTARKRPQTPKSAAKKSRKSRVLADSDSEAEEDKVDIEDNECDVMKELAESKVKETSKDELSVFDGGNSVKLFSESAASELGEKQSANRTNQELEK